MLNNDNKLSTNHFISQNALFSILYSFIGCFTNSANISHLFSIQTITYVMFPIISNGVVISAQLFFVKTVLGVYKNGCGRSTQI